MRWARWLELVVAASVAAGAWMLPGGGVASWGARFAMSGCGVFVLVVSVAALRRRSSRVHLANVAAAAGLIALGFRGWPAPPTAVLQLGVACGVLLLACAVVPTRASEPPESWERVYAQDPPRA